MQNRWLDSFIRRFSCVSTYLLLFWQTWRTFIPIEFLWLRLTTALRLALQVAVCRLMYQITRWSEMSHILLEFLPVLQLKVIQFFDFHATAYMQACTLLQVQLHVLSKFRLIFHLLQHKLLKELHLFRVVRCNICPTKSISFKNDTCAEFCHQAR